MALAMYAGFRVISSRKEQAGIPQYHLAAAAVMRYPSLVVPFQMMLMPSVLECSMHLLLNRSSENIPIGILGVLVNVVFTGVLLACGKTDHTKAELVHPESLATGIKAQAGIFFLGGSAWATTSDESPHYVERLGVLFESYRMLDKVLRGHYFLIEYAHVVPLSYIAAVPLSTAPTCVVKAVSLGLILFAQALFLVWSRCYISSFLQSITVATMFVGALSMFFSAISYAAFGTFETGWGDASVLFLQITINLCVVRGVYDVIVFIVNLASGYRTGIVGQVRKERQAQDDASAGSPMGQRGSKALILDELDPACLGEEDVGSSAFFVPAPPVHSVAPDLASNSYSLLGPPTLVSPKLRTSSPLGPRPDQPLVPAAPAVDPYSYTLMDGQDNQNDY
eukprot:TRINITY_DN58730_c0_g1_i1.p1 TRINITY_DN58730_c0_g1~~TRINITY_DN58730_c0_g1_i1.p1  ORF type:complete len:435 (+),score=125.51 TRINITY_DN58730_c0_g1_i1:126-1307(+)